MFRLLQCIIAHTCIISYMYYIRCLYIFMHDLLLACNTFSIANIESKSWVSCASPVIWPTPSHFPQRQELFHELFDRLHLKVARLHLKVQSTLFFLVDSFPFVLANIVRLVFQWTVNKMTKGWTLFAISLALPSTCKVRLRTLGKQICFDCCPVDCIAL